MKTNIKLDHTNVWMSPLSTYFSYDTRWWQSSLETTGFTTEAEGCRESTQHSVLPCTGWRRGVKWRFVLYWAGSVVLQYIPCPDKELLSCNLLASPAAAAAADGTYTTKCTQNTDMTKITRGRQGSAVLVQLDSSLGFTAWNQLEFFVPRNCCHCSQCPPSPIFWQPNRVLKFSLGHILRHCVSTGN
jgi:hypothetical protein